MSSDKRSSNRVPLDSKVHLEFEKFSGFVSEFAHNISEGGMYIKTPNPLPIGSIVSFEFKLKDSFQLIQGLGEVTWIRSNALSPDEPAGMGIRFREISDRSRDLVKAIVTQTKSQGDQPFNIDDHPDAVTSTISATQAAQVYGSDPLNNPFNSIPSSHDIKEAQNNADLAIDNLDAHLINDTVSNPNVQDNKENTPVDPALATQTSLYDTRDSDNLLNIDLDDPLISSNHPLDEHTLASMEDPMLSDHLSDSFELSLDEEMNDPEFDQKQAQGPSLTPKKPQSRIGLTIFLSLLVCSVLASAYLLKDAYLPELGNIPFLSQWFEQDPLTELNDNDNIIDFNQTSDAVEDQEARNEEDQNETQNAEAQDVEKKIQDITSEVTSSEPVQNEQSNKDIDVAPQEIDETNKTTVAKNTVENKTNPSAPVKKDLATQEIADKADVNKPVLSPSDSTTSNSDSSLLRVKNLTWTVDKDDWVLIIETDKSMNKDNIKHSSLRNGPARELLILNGMQKDFGSRTIAVGQTGVHRIRTGYHANQTPPQLHIVVDILDANIQMKRIQALGSIVKIYFGLPAAASSN